MSNKFFVTGTDTGIGKTYITAGLLRGFQKLGYSTLGIKPISSGAIKKNNILYNQDALDLLNASSIKLDYSYINPFVFEPAIAPHIAATQIGQRLSLKNVIEKSQHAMDYPSDIHLIEGVGGWSVPLNETETMVDFVLHHQLKVILVVGIRVGCINHAMLTYQAIFKENVSIVGWIANCYESNLSENEEIIGTLKNWIKIPYAGCVLKNEKPEEVLELTTLFL